MFTGLIQALGRIADLSETRLVVEAPAAWGAQNDPIQIGESIAIDGCCLTALDVGVPIRFDLSPETIARTAFGQAAIGDSVNLERAMRPSDRFGGHIVQGHVDATGVLISRETTAAGERFRFNVDPAFDRYLIDKGSVAIAGISLTVVEPKDGAFDIWVIPHTLEVTTLGDMKPGKRVNMEFDVIAKHVEKLVASR